MTDYAEMWREVEWEAARQGWDVKRLSAEHKAFLETLVVLGSTGPLPGIYVKVTSIWALVRGCAEAWPDSARDDPGELQYRIDTARWYRENVKPKVAS